VSEARTELRLPFVDQLLDAVTCTAMTDDYPERKAHLGPANPGKTSAQITFAWRSLSISACA